MYGMCMCVCLLCGLWRIEADAHRRVGKDKDNKPLNSTHTWTDPLSFFVVCVLSYTNRLYNVGRTTFGSVKRPYAFERRTSYMSRASPYNKCFHRTCARELLRALWSRSAHGS